MFVGKSSQTQSYDENIFKWILSSWNSFSPSFHLN